MANVKNNLLSNSLQNRVAKIIKPLSDKELCDLLGFLVEATIDKDLKPNDLQAKFISEIITDDVWEKHLDDIFNEKYFNSLSRSGKNFVQEVNHILLIESHFRLKATLNKPTLDLSNQEKKDLRMVISHGHRENEDKLLDSLDFVAEAVGDLDEAKDIVAERKRLSKLFPKVLKFLK